MICSGCAGAPLAGWFRSYNFGSEEAACIRWAAAAKARVDYIASDQYESLAAFLKSPRR